MSYNYEATKQQFESMSMADRERAMQQFGNDENFRRFATEYNAELQSRGNQSAQPTPAPQPSNSQPEQNYNQNQSAQYGQNWGNQVQYTQPQEQQPPQTQQQGQFQAQTQTQHQFWYGTTEDYRKKRDSQYAEELYNSNPNGFDYNSVFKYVKGQAPQVTEGEIRSTVQNINRQYNQFARLGAMNSLTPEQIRQGLLNGEYSQSDLEQLRIRNPQKYNEFMGYDDKATATENAAYNANAMYNLTTGKGIKQEASTEEKFLQIVQKFYGDISYNGKELVESYKRELNSPEIQRYKTKMLDAQREMQEIDDDLETLREDLTKQYPWISKSQLNSILQDRSYKLLKRKNELHKDYTRAKWEVEFWINMAGKNFEADLKGVELQRAEFQDKFSALGFAKSTLEFETPEQKRQAELDQIKKKAQLESELNDINSKDPQIQRTALMKALEPYYKDFGSIILRPQAQAVEDIIAQAKRERISVGEAFRKNFTEPLQGRDGYKKLMNRQYGISNEPKDPKLVDIWGQKYEYDPVTKQYSLPQLATGWEFTDFQLQGRANRNNNPTAMTTDVAKTLGMVEWVDYVRGDPFSSGSGTLYTAKLLGNGVETTINAFDRIAQDPNKKIFYTSGSRQRRTHTAMSDEERLGLSQEDKAKVIQRMYNNEERRDRRNFWAFGYSIGGGWGYSSSRAELYKSYLAEGKLPSDGKLKSMGVNVDQFTKEAYSYQEATGTTIETKEQKTEIASLRKEFNNLTEVKNYKTVEGMYNTVKSASELWTAAWDLSLIFAYMKILDPNSTVRESEFATAQNAGGVDDKIRNLFNNIRNGSRLTERQRADFKKSAQSLYNEYARKYNEVLDQYKSYAVGWGDVNRIGAPAQVAGVNRYVAEQVAQRLTWMQGQVSAGAGTAFIQRTFSDTRSAIPQNTLSHIVW